MSLWRGQGRLYVHVATGVSNKHCGMSGRVIISMIVIT